MEYRTKASESREKSVYALGDLLAVLRAMAGSPIEPAVILMAFCGCRVGESLGVMCSEVRLSTAAGVDVASAEIVRHVENGTGRAVDRLKNPQSARTVMVPGPVGARLHRLAVARAKGGDTWLCDDGTGEPLTQQTANRL